jgi:hypothetical protein
VAGSFVESKIRRRVSVRCSDALYTDLGSRGRRLGVSSRELKPKLERLQRPAGIHSLLVYRIDNAIAAACRRKEASFCMLPQIDRRGGSRGRKPL